eukprot:TRINITY_DN8780_c0_g1_i1.p1 TRINITY_DN8780_c0_g1~~TRINITY_DN8780_c0_g1_i1.p1  ORF type:complete len:296 (+),score=97.58 TRINITY_DN8780_c0_g1_i1:39-926(+)
MSGNGAREKALQFLREVPRLHRTNTRGLPRVAGIEGKGKYSKHGRGQQGYDAGWGSSAKQKLYFGPLGYEGGSSPIQRKTEFERSYNYGLRFQRQFPPITLAQLQLMIDTNRISTEQPLDMAALCGSKIARIDPQQNHFGFNLTSEGMDNFTAKVNIEVQWADEQSIAAVERAGGRLTCSYYDLHSVIALADPAKFFKSGSPIPRRLTPPANLMEFYVTAKNRGYLADPTEVAEERLLLSQKYGYELLEHQDDVLKESKDPRQIFYGLQPGWVVNLADKTIYKPADPQLEEVYSS